MALCVMACVSYGCSGEDQTRVAVAVRPGAGGDEAQTEAPLEPDSSEASGTGGSSDIVPGGPELVEQPSELPVPDGTATDNRSRPWIDDLSDWRVLRGEGVRVAGGQLLPNPNVLLGNRVVVPLEASLTSLKFVVPADLELARCEVTFKLLVKTDNGLSPSIELAVLERPPAITLIDPRVVVGQAVSLRVEPERGDGVLELQPSGRAGVRIALSRDGTLTLPPGTPSGPALLRWITPCGEAVTAIDVQAARTDP